MTDSAGNWPTWDDVKEYVDIRIHATIFILALVPSIIVQQLHYSRNSLNNTNYTEEELIQQGYEKENENSDKFHQNNQINGDRNRKYVIGDWFSSEVVYYADGTINDSPEDMGTFNVYSGEKIVPNIFVHGFLDVLPYMIWGNSINDSTTIIDRISMIWG